MHTFCYCLILTSSTGTQHRLNTVFTERKYTDSTTTVDTGATSTAALITAATAPAALLPPLLLLPKPGFSKLYSTTALTVHAADKRGRH